MGQLLLTLNIFVYPFMTMALVARWTDDFDDTYRRSGKMYVLVLILKFLLYVYRLDLRRNLL